MSEKLPPHHQKLNRKMKVLQSVFVFFILISSSSAFAEKSTSQKSDSSYSNSLSRRTTAQEESSQVSGRSNDDDIDGKHLSGLLIMGLLGATAAVYSNPDIREGVFGGGRSENRRQDYGGAPINAYAAKVRAAEDRFENRMSSATRSAVNWARSGAFRARRMGSSAGRLAGRGLHNFFHGLERINNGAHSLTRKMARSMVRGARRFNHGLRRMSHRTTHGLARVGFAAGRGFRGFGNAFSRNWRYVGNSAYNGIKRIGSGTTNHLKRFGHNYANSLARMGIAYRDRINRMGSYATNRMGTIAGESVSRIGELASEGADLVGGVAWKGADLVGGVASNIAEVASKVPGSIAEAAKEKTVQDCLLQTICYASTPFLRGTTTLTQRRSAMRRSIDEQTSIYEESGRQLRALDDSRLWPSSRQIKDNSISEITDNSIDAGGETFDPQFNEEDCEVFQCEIASVGKKAIGYVREFSRELA